MPDVYCVHANFGSFTSQFLRGGYAAIGWVEERDLGKVTSKDELYAIYRKYYPEEKSNLVIGQQVGQIARFLFDIKPGDYVITPAANPELLQVGIMAKASPYFHADDSDGCPFPHRRKIEWLAKPNRPSNGPCCRSCPAKHR